MQHGKHGGQRPAQQQHDGRPQGVRQRRQAGRHQGVGFADETKLEHARSHLRRANERAHGYRSGQAQAGELQDARKVRGHGRADKPRHAKGIGQAPPNAPVHGCGRLDGFGSFGGFMWRGRVGGKHPASSGARQARVEGQGHQHVQHHPTPTRPTPAPFGRHPSAERPAHGAGKTRNEGDAGDGRARLVAKQTHQGGKGCFIKASPHGQAQHAPCQSHVQGVLRHRQTSQAQHEDTIAQHEHWPSTKTIDGFARAGPNGRAEEHGQRESHEDLGWGDAQALGHGLGQHRWQVIAGTPSQGLGQPQEHDVARLWS